MLGGATVEECVTEYYCFKSRNRSLIGAVTQFGILDIHNFVVETITMIEHTRVLATFIQHRVVRKAQRFNIIIGNKCV